MTRSRSLKWIAGVMLVPTVLVLLFIVFFNWNWLRGPIERMATEKTGRALIIQGDLKVKFGWPWPRIYVNDVTFANPAWAKENRRLYAAVKYPGRHCMFALCKPWLLIPHPYTVVQQDQCVWPDPENKQASIPVVQKNAGALGACDRQW